MFIVIGNRIDSEASVYKATAQNYEQLLVRLIDAFKRKDAEIVTVRKFTPPETKQEPSQIGL